MDLVIEKLNSKNDDILNNNYIYQDCRIPKERKCIIF
jgi:hypothetical protein